MLACPTVCKVALCARAPAFSHRVLSCTQGDTVEQLLPLFLNLLKDEWPDVRLAIIGKLQAVNQVRLRVVPRNSTHAKQHLPPGRSQRPLACCRSSALSCWRRRCCLLWRTWLRTSTGVCGRPSSSTRQCLPRRCGHGTVCGGFGSSASAEHVCHVQLVCPPMQLGAELFQQKLGRQCMLWLQVCHVSLLVAVRSLCKALSAYAGLLGALALAGFRVQHPRGGDPRAAGCSQGVWAGLGA